jgi:N-acetylmuramoyl-L-alanine amidase
MKALSNISTAFILISILLLSTQGKEKERPKTLELSERELLCMVANVYHEARGEDALGQAAVAWVTLNRVRSPHYPDTICGVVLQPDQFSWFSDGKSDRMTDPEAIQKAVDVALAVTRGKIKDPTSGSMHYFAHKRVKPAWAKAGFRFILGQHTFVKLAGN